jgi:signal transduction histidine kinase
MYPYNTKTKTEQENKSLRKRLVELINENDRLRKQKEELEKINKQKSMLIAGVSHDILTPLNSIIGFSYLIKTKKLTKKDILKYNNIIYKNSNELLSKLKDIIDLSKIDINKLNINKSNFDIIETLDDIYSLFSINDKIINNNITIKIDYEHVNNKIIYSDKYRIEQILMNLISNSIKFTNSGEIIIGCYTTSDKIHFYVKDTGIGISKDNIKNIFNWFYQIDTENINKKRGYGLGLSIVKHLVTLLDGNICVRSIENKGTIFKFYIPINHD